MAASRKRGGDWPLAFRSVGLNNDTDLIKLIAMITMLIDHTGKMLFRSNLMRIVGRMAFPIYAYCIAVGCVYSKDRLKYLSRVVLTGLISQPFYAVALGHVSRAMYAVPFRTDPVGAVVNFYVQSWHHPSIFLTLTLGILVIWTIRERQLVLTAALALLVWRMQGTIDYDWRGVTLIALFYLTCSKWWLSLPVVFAFMFWWGMSGMSYQAFGIRFGIQMFALMALPLIYIPTRSGIKINKWVFYLFYPAHMIGMLLIEMALKMV